MYRVQVRVPRPIRSLNVHLSHTEAAAAGRFSVNRRNPVSQWAPARPAASLVVSGSGAYDGVVAAVTAAATGDAAAQPLPVRRRSRSTEATYRLLSS